MSGGGLRELTRNQKTDAALHNEAVTRGRVTKLEVAMRQVFEGSEPLRRGFWGRLRWLFLGR